jgi:hypothetical protein
MNERGFKIELANRKGRKVLIELDNGELVPWPEDRPKAQFPSRIRLIIPS